MFYFFLCDRLVWFNYSSSYCDVNNALILPVYTSKRFLSHFPVQLKSRKTCTKSTFLCGLISTVTWFFLRTHVNFACVNRIEAMSERSRGNVEVAFSCETLYNASLLLTRVKFTWVLVRKFATVEIHVLYVIRCKSVSLTLKQAKRASMRSQSDQTGYVVELKAPCKRTQHC